MTYAEALHILRTLGPELRTGTASPAAVPRKFSLDHIALLLAHLGNPQGSFRAVLVAGTNGKGSTAATLAAIAAAAGLRTGLYTSPHLLRVNERMRTSAGGAATGPDTELRDIRDADFGRLFGRAWDAAAALVRDGALPHTPSFFELLTATAFLFFAEQHIELAVLEVGLGGRLDATNVVEPLVSVITDIGIDHTEFLGETITEIAREKAGILRPDGVLVTLSQHPEANAAIGEAAVRLGVRGVDASRFLPLRGLAGHTSQGIPAPPIPRTHPLPQPNENEREGPVLTPALQAEPALREPSAPQQTVGISSPLARNRYDVTLDGAILHLDSPLSGQHQGRNLALAVAAAVELRTNHGFAIPNTAIEAGVAAVRWPGRLEWLAGRRTRAGTVHAPVLLDVAHNPAGAWALRAALAQLPEVWPRTLLFSCLADKKIEEMARILLPLFDPTAGDPLRRYDHIVFAPIENPRAATVAELEAVAHSLDVPVHAAPHVPGALLQAEALTPPGGVIVVTGSVYLVGEIRALLLAEPAFDPPHQTASPERTVA